MKIYLVRHGKASKDPTIPTDAERPLVERGREDTAKIGQWMAHAGIEVHEIRHSGLVRAAQTAEILGTYLQPAGGIKAVKGLHFMDSPEILARELHLEPAPVMFVGHNPFMEHLAGLLLTGSAGRTPVYFTTACTACLESFEGDWTVRWVLNREIIRGLP